MHRFVWRERSCGNADWARGGRELLEVSTEYVAVYFLSGYLFLICLMFSRHTSTPSNNTPNTLTNNPPVLSNLCSCPESAEVDPLNQMVCCVGVKPIGDRLCWASRSTIHLDCLAFCRASGVVIGAVGAISQPMHMWEWHLERGRLACIKNIICERIQWADLLTFFFYSTTLAVTTFWDDTLIELHPTKNHHANP
jgi:hypothetical protein